jgi:hypothetical protein
MDAVADQVRDERAARIILSMIAEPADPCLSSFCLGRGHHRIWAVCLLDLIGGGGGVCM